MPRCGATTVLSASPTPSPRAWRSSHPRHPHQPLQRHVGFVTGYDYIRRRIRCGTGRSGRAGHHAGRGQLRRRGAWGASKLSDHIHAMRGKKPVRDGQRQLLLGGLRHRICRRQHHPSRRPAAPGSIGVVTMHVDCLRHWRRPASGVLHLRRQAIRSMAIPTSRCRMACGRYTDPHRRHLPEVRGDRGPEPGHRRSSSPRHRGALLHRRRCQGQGLIDAVAPPYGRSPIRQRAFRLTLRSS